ncbi:hypothetical protein JWG44_21835 [Leptospira sp. 201903071]|uniref:hypothetical protein n=1 Tax=Leptospira ainazelensis TaxID=2810034 RepID=UPI001963E922|nr:hypothetical protein [Leptospira ainazelensis]MBM9502897.1 hypothetical protein [Leptospira ainazelensis]
MKGKNVIHTLLGVAVLMMFSNCVSFGQDRIESAKILAPQKKLEKTYFVYTIKNYNAFGVDIGVGKGETDTFEKTIKSEIDSCSCFKEYEVVYLKEYSKEQLPKDKNVIFYDINYRVTSNAGLMTFLNFLSMGTIGIIPTGYRFEVTADIKLLDRKQQEIKTESYKNQAVLVGGTLMIFVAPFREQYPYILEKITTNFLATIVGSNMIALVK